MSYDWKEYLELAAFLAPTAGISNVSQETTRRCAISRAYYAAFNVARQKLRSAGEQFPGSGQDHILVVRALKRRGIQDSRNRLIHARLRQLHFSRCKADYDAVVANLERLTSDALKEAALVIAAVEQSL